jgi:hypothetical protein
VKINPIKTNNFSKKIANFIEKSPKTQKILRFADRNPSLFNATVVFGLATIFRPSTILLTSSKSEDKKQDAIYSSAKSIASGCVDLLSALVIFIPFNKAIDKSTRKLFNNPKISTYFQNKEACSAWKSLANRGAKIALLPGIAYLNFKYVRTLVDKMRNNENTGHK